MKCHFDQLSFVTDDNPSDVGRFLFGVEIANGPLFSNDKVKLSTHVCGLFCSITKSGNPSEKTNSFLTSIVLISSSTSLQDFHFLEELVDVSAVVDFFWISGFSWSGVVLKSFCTGRLGRLLTEKN